MKRIIVILATAALFCTSASAQSIFDIFKKDSSTTKTESTTSTSSTAGTILDMATTIFGNVVNTTVSMPGTWTYNGSAVVLKSSTNTLSNVASAAAQTTIQQKVDEYLGKVGITSGFFKLTFSSDNTFVLTLKKKNFSGTWAQEGNNVKLMFGKTFKSLQLDGVVKKTTAGCEMLFTADKFLAFMKTAMKYAGTVKSSSTLSTISDLLENYDGMYIGFQLVK